MRQNGIVNKLKETLPTIITLRELEIRTDGLIKFNTIKMKTYPEDLYERMGKIRYFDTEKLLNFLFKTNDND